MGAQRTRLESIKVLGGRMSKAVEASTHPSTLPLLHQALPALHPFPSFVS